MYIMKRREDKTHPCHTPDVTGNLFVNPTIVRVALSLSLYMALTHSSSIPFIP
uniref:Uncharacterized protein n=1 Tax=Arion vulgaris TaxID=1028688 RepID=A0A0B7AYR2_9EUPU